MTCIFFYILLKMNFIFKAVEKEFIPFHSWEITSAIERRTLWIWGRIAQSIFDFILILFLK